MMEREGGRNQENSFAVATVAWAQSQQHRGEKREMVETEDKDFLGR